MGERPWFKAFFDEDYLVMYRDALPPERTELEVEGIVNLLDLEPGSKILDLACGHGRHSIPLAKRGFDVTGYDLSRHFLDIARADSEAAGVDVRWVQGDMRELDFEEEFDAVINVFTSFGYFEEPEDDLKTLKGIRTALRQGGRFLLEILHRDALFGRFEEQGVQKTSDGNIVVHDRSWDLAKNILHDEMTLIRPDGTRKSYMTSVRPRSLHEFLGLYEEAGLEPVAWYGGLGGSPLTLSSHRLALLSRRP